MSRRNCRPCKQLVAVLACIPILLFLTACDATLTTSVDIDRSGATGGFELMLDGEAAKAVIDDPATDQRLYELVASRSGTTVERTATDGTLRYRSGYNPNSSSFSTQSGVALGQVTQGNDGVTVRMSFLDPIELRDALVAANMDLPDAAARQIVMEKSISICGRVSFGGQVRTFSASPELTVEQSGQTVIACAALGALGSEELELVATGSSETSRVQLYVGAALIGLLAAVVIYRRALKR